MAHVGSSGYPQLTHHGIWTTLTPFLTAYPHPAFVIHPRALVAGAAQSVFPTYANPAFSQIFGRDVSHDFLNSLRHTGQKEDFKRWLLGTEPTISLEIVTRQGGLCNLDVTKTQVDAGAWVCTTVPRTSHELTSPNSGTNKDDNITFSLKNRLTTSLSSSGIASTGRLTLSSENAPPIHESPISVSELMETFDWSKTSIGPKETWPQSLKSALSIVLETPFPICLFWGPDSIGFYNDAYLIIAGPKHPSIWGMPIKQAWSETWSVVEKDVNSVMNGTPVFKYDDQLFLNRLTGARLPQEYYITWSYTPVRQEDGGVGGFTCLAFDSTEKVIASRRMNLLREVITNTITTTSRREYGDALIASLSKEPYHFDISFAALYFCSVNPMVDKSARNTNNVMLDLAGTVGVPQRHETMPDRVTIRIDSAEGFLEPSNVTTSTDSNCPWPFLEAIQSHQIVHVPQLPGSATMDYERRGWGDPPREAVIIPIGYSDEAVPVPSALLVVGTNTRRPYNEIYRGDTNIVRMTLNSTLHGALSREAQDKRAKQLAELDAAKTAFFSNVSHELRTPLTLIDGPLEDSINDVLDENTKKQLQMAQRNVYRLTKLVDSLMDFSKLAANKLEGHFRPIKLGIFTAGLASLFRRSVEKGGLTFNVECDDNPKQPTCYIDPDFWEKIVFNLIGNALKFTIQGSITVGVMHTPHSAILNVEDSGVGISPEDIPKIFDRFYRAQTTSRSHEGSGIGLSLTKELVAIHGGELRVTSNSNPNGVHGTIFTVTMPLGKDHLPQGNVTEDDSISACQRVYARGVIEEASLWTSRSPNVSRQGSLMEEHQALRAHSSRLDPSVMFFTKSDVVLIVDDNADMREYMRSIISRYCTVIEASNGQDALDLAVAVKPDVILSDVMMPVMDGFALLQKLRDKPETRLIPVILVTAKSGEGSRVEGLLSGADDYLIKPFKGTELIARVHLQMQLGKKRVDMEAKFIERTSEMLQLSEMSPVGIFRVDDNGRIKYVNPRWYDITGCTKNQELNEWLNNVHNDDQSAVLRWWETCQNKYQGSSPPIDFRWNNGNWCQGQCVWLENNGALGAFTDISQQKELESMRIKQAIEQKATALRKAEEAEERRKEAEERRRGQELLIDVTSHELRQPVSAILNCSSLVRQNLSNLRQELLSSGNTLRATPERFRMLEDDLEALDAIYQCGLVQERIANDVLCLSRLQLGVLSIQPVEFNLRKEVGRIMALFRNEAQMKKIQLNVQFDDSVERLGICNISTDRARFSQVVTNLLSNAVKFTDASTGKRDILVDVSVGVESPGPNSCRPPILGPCSSKSKLGADETLFVYVSVTDSGPGLEPEDLTRLFQRFQQGSHSHDVFGGSGLGLFVSRQLCSLMGGRIEVLSTLGEGATFRFFVQATGGAFETATNTLSPYQIEKLASQPETPHPIHVLITEDNLINQTILNRQLKKAGCTTVLANNGQQAIEELCMSTKPFDAILMDVEMPVLDGLSAVREIRHMEATGKLPRRHRVFALTGNAREGQVQNIRQAGMDDVMIKPYRIDDILAKICDSTRVEHVGL